MRNHCSWSYLKALTTEDILTEEALIRSGYMWSLTMRWLQVQDVLGLQAQKAAGPGGGEHWDSTPEAAKQDADTFLRSV